jgi:antitoxin HigA-1
MSLKKEHKDFSVEFGPNNDHQWSAEKLSQADKISVEIASKRTSSQQLRNQIRSVRYRMEEYIQNQDVVDEEIIMLDTWLKEYLKVLSLTQKRFAEIIENKDKNLRKYLIGERRFSTDLAMKFGFFFHTSPDLWLKVQIKNEFLLLQREKETKQKYSKYDYEKVQITI